MEEFDKNSNISYSMYIDSDTNFSVINNNLPKVQQRAIHTWIDDNAVVRCFSCDSEFTLFRRKHHCRSCGRIFCHNCSTNKTHLPKDIGKYPKAPVMGNTYKIIEKINLIDMDKESVRVCDKCFIKLKEIESLYNLIKIFSVLELDIKQVKLIARVSKNWYNASLSYISKFRELQYKLPCEEFTEKERKILWINRNYFIGHSNWLVKLIRSIKKDDDKKYKIIIDELLNNTQKKIDCWCLMCTRSCRCELSSENAIDLLNKNIINYDIRKYGVHYLSKSHDKVIECLLPLIVYYLRFEHGLTPLSTFIISRCLKSKILFNDFYWELIIQLEDIENQVIYSKILDSLIQLAHNKYGVDFIDNISKAKTFSNILTKCNSNKSIEEIKKYLKTNINAFELGVNNISLPIFPQYLALNLNIEKLEIKKSSKLPMVLSFDVINQADLDNIEGKGKNIFNYKTIFKQEDIRKDKIILSIIRMMDMILKNEEELDLNIVSYRVIPITSAGGYLEIINGAETLYHVNEKLGFSIQNYILNKNPESTVSEIREKFMKSTAAFCVITYLLGIGDRHLDNIMVTEEGILFHIDFGFIVGFDPKPMAPNMRITMDMVDAIGGINSENYIIFKKICTQAFNCLRRHTDLFMHMILLLSNTTPKINDNFKISDEELANEIINRFLPGHSYEEAELQFIVHMEKSYNTSKHALYDFIHYHNKEETLSKSLSNVVSKASYVAKNIFNYISYN
jgi:phosphatidylinositol 3-kinase